MCLSVCVSGNDDAKRLYYDLLKLSYNKLIRPVTNSSDKLIVKMGIRLSQLIDIVSTFVSEKPVSLGLDEILL